MSWLFAAVVLAGAVLGRTYRAPALIVASAVAALAFAVAARVAGYSAVSTLGHALGGAAALQAGYLIGLATRLARGGSRDAATRKAAPRVVD